MPPHQYDIVFGQTLSKVTALGRIGYEKVCISELIGDIPDRNMCADKTSGVNYRLERNLANAEGQAVLGMRMNHSIDVRARRVDAGVNESFNRRLPAVGNRLFACRPRQACC